MTIEENRRQAEKRKLQKNNDYKLNVDSAA